MKANFDLRNRAARNSVLLSAKHFHQVDLLLAPPLRFLGGALLRAILL